LAGKGFVGEKIGIPKRGKIPPQIASLDGGFLMGPQGGIFNLNPKQLSKVALNLNHNNNFVIGCDFNQEFSSKLKG